MRKIIAAAFVSLDGVMQAPGGPTEDPTGGFDEGGWMFKIWDPGIEETLGALFSGDYDLLLGRRTYDIFAAYWPYAEGDNKPMSEAFDRANKYVLTRGDQPLDWQNSHRLSGIEDVAALKRGEGPPMIIQGSSTIYPALLAASLIDELTLMIFPVVLGKGKRLFGEGTPVEMLRMTNHKVTGQGTVIATFEPGGGTAPLPGRRAHPLHQRPRGRAPAAHGGGHLVTLALYGHPFSSYTWKALIALYANGTEFEFREIDPSVPKYESFTGKVHPSGQFPVLTDGEVIVVETSSIVEHLAVHHPGPAPLIPADPAEAVVARMLDRVFDHYVMGNMQRVIAAYFVDKDDPGAGGMREEPFAPEIEAGKAGLRRAYAWLERWLGENTLPPHVSLVTCAAAPSLFYADWVEPIPADCPRLAALRAELLALPPVARCVEDARPYRPYFPYGAPDRD